MGKGIGPPEHGGSDISDYQSVISVTWVGSGVVAWLVRGSVVRRCLYFGFVLLVESSLSVRCLVRGFLLFLLFLLFLEECSVYIITAVEVQYENEYCQTDENCRGEVHGKDWCLMALLMTFYTGRLTAGPGLRHLRYQLHVTITPHNTTSIRAIYQSIYTAQLRISRYILLFLNHLKY